MNFLISHERPDMYLDRFGGWVNDVSAAKQFASRESAVEFRRKFGYSAVETQIVLFVSDFDPRPHRTLCALDEDF